MHLFKSVIDIFGLVSTRVFSVFTVVSTAGDGVATSDALVAAKWLVVLKFSTALRSDLFGIILSGDVFSLHE